MSCQNNDHDTAPAAENEPQPAITSHRRPRVRWLILATILAATLFLLSRWPLVQGAVHGKIGNFDELQLTLSATDRFLGLPATALHWPGGPQQILLTAALAVDYAAKNLYELGPKSLVDYLGQLYRSPWCAVRMMRFIVAVFCCVGFTALLPATAKRTGSLWAGLLCVVLLAAHPMLFTLTYYGMGDGPSMALLAATLACLLNPRVGTRLIVLSGILAGMALASKFTVAMAFPLVTILLLANSQQRLKAIGVFVAAAAISFLVTCPYLLTDPMRMVKAVVGNVDKQGDPIGLFGALWAILGILRVALSISLLAAIIVAVKQRHWALLIGTLCSLLLALLLTMGAANVHTKYYMPMIVVSVVFAIAVLWPACRSWLDRLDNRWRISVVAAAAVGLVALLITYGISDYRRSNPNRYANYYAAANDLADMPAGTKVIVPPYAANFMGKHISSKAMLRLAEDCERGMINGESVLAFARNAVNMPDDAVRILAPVLNEDEQAFAKNMRAAAGLEDRPGLDVYLVSKKAARYNVLTAQQAVTMWQRGEVDVLVHYELIDGHQPNKVYDTPKGQPLWRYDRPNGPN